MASAIRHFNLYQMSERLHANGHSSGEQTLVHMRSMTELRDEADLGPMSVRDVDRYSGRS